MRVDIVTLFPGMFAGPMSESILLRAREKGLLQVAFTNPRDFAVDRHRTVDDRPYGGGPGMLLMAEPLYQAVRRVKRRGSRVILMSPRGKPFDQATARRLAACRHLVLVCGHYEGVDERFLDCVDMELSLGDFILTGGEIAAMAVTDAVARLLPGVLAKEDAVVNESFTQRLLEGPQYTRPRVWRRRKVPEVLLSGDHARIEEWRGRTALESTKRRRRDLLK
ncbi:MAG: tRNA (guanosine(37)-N1)-methyltransferase TrmD [Elusimicrobiota bacterium]